MNIKNFAKNVFKKIHENTIIKNSILLIMTNIFSLATGFFFWMIATRLYTPSDVGIISAILSSMSLIAVISSVGLPMTLTLYLPVNTKDANKIINSSLIVGMMVPIIVSLIFLLEIDMFAPKLKIILGNLELMIIFSMTTMMSTISLFISGIFIAGRRSSFHMVKENIFGIVKIVLLAMMAGFGAAGIFISWSLGLVAAMIVGFILMFKLWRYSPTITFDPIIKKMARFSVGNYIAGIFYNIPRFIFPIIIINTISAESAGYFFIAMTIAGLFYGVPEAVAGPFLANSYDKEKFWVNVNSAIRFNMYVLIPGLLLLMIFGKFVLSLFNPNYAIHSFNTLIILAVTSLPMSLITTFNMVMNAQKKVMTVIKIDAFVTIMTLIFSIILMRVWNIEGIAVSYLIANTVMSLVIMFRTKNRSEFNTILTKGEITTLTN